MEKSLENSSQLYLSDALPNIRVALNSERFINADVLSPPDPLLSPKDCISVEPQKIREGISRIEEVPKITETWNLFQDNLVIADKRERVIGDVIADKRSFSDLHTRNLKEEDTTPPRS